MLSTMDESRLTTEHINVKSNFSIFKKIFSSLFLYFIYGCIGSYLLHMRSFRCGVWAF